MRPTPRRILGYARVSSIEQTLGTSLQDQQDAIRAYARSIGCEVARMFVEAESGIHEKIERREQIRTLLADVRAGDLILVDKLDRWSRDPEFTYGSVRRILEAGARWYAVGEQCDPSTPEGDSMLGLRALYAREEHKRIKLRLVGTRKLLRDRGYYPEGEAPWGYRRQAVKGPERNALVIDEAIAPKVRDAFRLCMAGRSLTTISGTLGESITRLHKSLRNRLYLGEVRDSRGQWIPAKHQALIDADTFARVQDTLSNRWRGRTRTEWPGALTSTWWLRDIARCGRCGAKMTSAYGAKREFGGDMYFRCKPRCGARYVHVHVAERDCDPMVLEHLEDLRDELAKPAKKPAAPTVDRDAIGAELRKLETRRVRLLELYADGTMTRTELDASLAKADDRRTRLQAKLVEAPPVDASKTREVLRSVTEIRRMWTNASPTVRRRIVNELAVSVGLVKDEPPVFVWKTAEEITREK